MKHIRFRIYILALIFVLSAVTCTFIILFGAAPSKEISAYVLFAVLLLIAGIAVTLWVNEFKQLKILKLITENPIMHICTVVISDISAESVRTENTESTEITVSYFGILLNSRLIKFNQDGIRLRGVEFGPDYISLIYGTDNRIQSTRLLRPAIPREELGAIVDKFRYETGIVPNIRY